MNICFFHTMASELAYTLCFLLLLQLPFYTTAQINGKNIPLGTTLTALDNKSFWASPSGEFAFGFQEIGKHGFLLAIWFNKIPERTIVWSANGNNLVQKGSTVELTQAGQFRLNDIATGKQIWNASAGTGVAYAAMLDTGNFVLANRNSTNLWESFDQPTDTILPTQTLNQSSRLFARYTPSNYSRGRFMFTLQSDGNLVLYTTQWPLDSQNSPYWSSDTKGSGFQVMFNQSGSIYVTAMNRSILATVSNKTTSMQDFYQRATLDYDGVFRHYVYPKRTGSGSSFSVWTTAWSDSTLPFIPTNICTSIEQYGGGGACGFNSICKHDQRPICECPDGYSFIDPDDKLQGCKQNFVAQSCGDRGSSPEAHLFNFQEMQDTDWLFNDYNKFDQVSEDWCRQACLIDCYCAVAIYNKTGKCYLKGTPFINGRIDPSGGGKKALIKIRNENSTLRSGGKRKDDNSAMIIVGSVLLSSSGFLNFVLLLITYVGVSRIYHGKAKVTDPNQVMNLKYFSYKELEEATSGFKEELGHGAFATVFKGVLASDNGKSIAVKRLDNMVKENESEFKAEMSAIGRTNHKNLVQLLGFCNEEQHRILVYEFMSNGTLASFLFGDSIPNWYRRRQIALGIARGLLYLHEECSIQIIHCDIKPQNILLDETFTARISDFGLAKLLKMDQTHTTTRIRGTKGYVAPEWFKNMPITLKVDVYSYGILLLEILCCRKSFDQEAEDEDQMILADWAYDCYEQKKLHQLFKNDDEQMEDIKKMEKYVMIALWCIQDDPSLRPTTKELTLMLEGTVEVSIPPNPSSFTRLVK